MISVGGGIYTRLYGEGGVMDKIRNILKALGNQTDVWLNLL
jgi:hypothetical protein